MLIHYSQNDNLEKILSENKYVIVDFFATWCNPCRMLTPVIEELASKHKDITFVKIDVDQFRQEAFTYKISSIPAIFYFKEKEIKFTSLGYMSTSDFEEKIQSLLN